MKEITFEEAKELFKQAIDETDTIFEALGRTIQLVYQKGYADGRASMVEEFESLKEEIRGRCRFSINKIDVLDIIDKHISELKGENNGNS